MKILYYSVFFCLANLLCNLLHTFLHFLTHYHDAGQIDKDDSHFLVLKKTLVLYIIKVRLFVWDDIVASSRSHSSAEKKTNLVTLEWDEALNDSYNLPLTLS